MAKVTFIVYEGDGEVLVTTPKHEAEFLEQYGPHYDWTDYDRTEYAGSQVVVESRQLLVSD